MPRQVEENGLTREQLTLSDDAIREVITSYTRESGVRQLERELGRLARKVARRSRPARSRRETVDREDVRPLLGRPRVHPEKMAREDQVGIATGMYYTPAGGDIMFVEASLMRGKGELILTGQLGDVMKESARAAWTFARSHAALARHRREGLRARRPHPRAGRARFPRTAPRPASRWRRRSSRRCRSGPSRNDVAMTGEITISGRVLPIGGLKEKILGAVRAGITAHRDPEGQRGRSRGPAARRCATRSRSPRSTTLAEALAVTLRDTALRRGGSPTVGPQRRRRTAAGLSNSGRGPFRDRPAHCQDEAFGRYRCAPPGADRAVMKEAS